MNLVCSLVDLYVLAIIGRAILSWFPLDPRGPMAGVAGFLIRITEPVFAPVRRVMPNMGPFDLTPLVVLIGVQLLSRILLGC
ncbi:MAG: YggT family protein [Actinomycetota bacterium]